MPRARFRRGFTLLELVIVLAVLSILAGVLIPIVKQMIDSAKVSKLTAQIDSLSNACRRYYKDTKTFATEDGGSDDLLDHTLAFNPNPDPQNPAVAGWNGPYIEGPVINKTLPFEGATIRLSPTANSGYQLAGQNGPTTSSDKGQELFLMGIPLNYAKLLDRTLDGKEDQALGRVKWRETGNGKADLDIFILDPFGIPN